MKGITRDFDWSSYRKIERVYIAELDIEFIMRELSGQQLTEVSDKDQFANLALMIVDENLQRIYTTAEDIDKLREMPHSIFTKLAEASRRLNLSGQQEQEETIKNLSKNPNGASAFA